MRLSCCSLFFFFNDTATTEIYTLSLHDALPILVRLSVCGTMEMVMPCAPRLIATCPCTGGACGACGAGCSDRKSTRLNSSHQIISYAVFCLKKKKKDR